MPAGAAGAQEPLPPGQTPPAESDEGEIIVVIGIPDILRDIPPERDLDEDMVAGYGVSTVEDLIDELNAELGEDEEPIFLINGERVDDLDEIAGYPTEAIRRLQVLPRGSGNRVGASANRRVYSITLRRQLRSATATAAPRFATAGDWSAVRVETILTRIRGPNRFNLSLRVTDETSLLEAERGIIQPDPRQPFDIFGNIIAAPDGSGEIDPQLSALAGTIVALAGVPAGQTPTLADFAAGANRANVTDVGAFRTLRPDTRRYDLGLSLAMRLAPWLTANANGRLDHSLSESLRGLASALFLLPEANPFSPFSRNVLIARYLEREGLDQSFRSLRGNIVLGLNATFGQWRVNLRADRQDSETRTLTERQDFAQQSGPIAMGSARNPFAEPLDDLLLIATDRSVSRSSRTGLQLVASGSSLRLPAGPLRLTMETRLAWSDLDTRSEFLESRTRRSFSRWESGLRGAAEIPLTSRRQGFLSEIGDFSANLEYSIVDYSGAGSLEQYSYGLVWAPLEWVRLNAAVNRVRQPIDLQLLFDPVSVTPLVRTFDFLRSETVDVTWISGGNPDLIPESNRTERFAANVRPMPSINLHLNAEYLATRNRNFVSSLPPASVPILLAFPERFQRDANGVLTLVDLRPVNFASYKEDRLRYGFSFNVPLGGAASVRPSPDDGGSDSGQAEGGDEEGSVPMMASGPRPRLQVSANHTVIFDNEILIRSGLAPIDLLEGGAIGVAGGRPRHQFDFTLGLSQPGTGVRLTGIWRGANELETRSGGGADRLRFSSYAILNLRGFVEGRRVFPRAEWLRNSRFSLSVVNLANERQRVVDSLGNTPLQYQPGYRDPLGRTIEFEIRKVF